MRDRGRLFIISAPSGSGKTTLEKMLLSAGLNLEKSISVTTRRPRKGEKNGRDYFFISEGGFLKKRESGNFLEWAKVFDSYYATPKARIEETLNKGKNVILSIDVQGARQVKRSYPEAVLIFLKAPDTEALRARLTERLTNTPQEIKRRLQAAAKELAQSGFYDYVVINDDLNRAFEELRGIIQDNLKRC
ncbi:MAG: guanylate kinase [Candidatus Omnitrophica bacterium]|nr:guanylate kinase [Candidatus Omnitrophota bacterium]